MSRLNYGVVAVKWLLGLGLLAAALWTVQVAPDWDAFAASLLPAQILFLAALVVGLLEREVWRWLCDRVHAPLASRLAAHSLLILLAVLVIPWRLTGAGLVLGVFIAFNLLMLALSLILRNRSRDGLINLAVSLGSLAICLVILEVLSPRLTALVANRQHQAAYASAVAQAAAPPDPSQFVGQSTDTGGSLTPHAEYIKQGPGAPWGPLTGWGTNIDSVLHYWMDGVYDNTIDYNHLGFRGPEISYDKPDDVYRIMLIGDSFMEAREVSYDNTVYAQLGQMLANARTPDGKRIEVFGVGATGWGTLQEYLYYHNEGYRFHPDLILDFFIINDVADDNPRQFYPDRTIDFQVDANGVQLITGGAAAPEQIVNPAQRWFDALPPALANTGTVAFLRRVIIPPRESITLAGDLTHVHPQNYIYVASPDIAGYPEGWRRTGLGFDIWAAEAKADGARLMVVPVDISVERITEISTYFADQQQGWVWDMDLPYKRLDSILNPIGVDIIPTRDTYENYAHQLGQRPFDTLFYVQDGHWNPTGHRVTAQLLDQTLHDKSLVIGG